MQCTACLARLDHEDNYCRKCGAAVEVYDLEIVRAAPPAPMRRVDMIRAAAMPAVTRGATVIVAGTLVRFAVKQLLGRSSSRAAFPFPRRPLSSGEVEEGFFFYRRTRAD